MKDGAGSQLNGRTGRLIGSEGGVVLWIDGGCAGKVARGRVSLCNVEEIFRTSAPWASMLTCQA